MKTTTRMFLIAGATSVFLLAAGWFIVIQFKSTKSKAKEGEFIYVEDENAVEFEIEQLRLRPADDPVLKNGALTKPLLPVNSNPTN